MTTIDWNADVIDLKNLIDMSRGDSRVTERYLEQFLQLIPGRIENLKESLQVRDRKTTRQILHQMSPQLQFFGVPGVVEPIRRLGLEYESMDWDELQQMAQTIIGKLQAACVEIENVLAANF